MLAWRIATMTVLLSLTFSTAPSVMGYFGLDLFNSDFYYENQFDIGSDVGTLSEQSTENADVISAWSIPVTIISFMLELFINMATANYGLFQLCHVPVEIWTIYATLHYLSILTITYYIISGKDIEGKTWI
jgi:hypothetical protein